MTCDRVSLGEIIGAGTAVAASRHLSFIRYLMALVVIAPEFGCARPKPHPLKSTLNAWIGWSIADFVDQRGQPTNMADLGQGRAVSNGSREMLSRARCLRVVVTPPELKFVHHFAGRN